MVLLNKTYALQNNFFSHLRFGFQEGVGFIKASFIILGSINHMLKSSGKIFICFLDVRKAFDTIWIDGLLFKLFSEFRVKGRSGSPSKTCTLTSQLGCCTVALCQAIINNHSTAIAING